MARQKNSSAHRAEEGYPGEEKFEFLAAIVRSSEDAIIGEMLDGTITSWNPAAEKMFGYTEREILEKPMSILGPADRVGEFREIIEKARKGIKVERYETICTSILDIRQKR